MKNKPINPFTRIAHATKDGGTLMKGTQRHESRKHPSAKRQREQWKKEACNWRD